MKDNKGWESFVKDKKYDIDKYLLKINKQIEEFNQKLGDSD